MQLLVTEYTAGCRARPWCWRKLRVLQEPGAEDTTNTAEASEQAHQNQGAKPFFFSPEVSPAPSTEKV